MLRDGAGRQLGAVVVLHDVTELRRLEQVRSDFVANVSHEIRTPVSAVKAAVETLLDDRPPTRRTPGGSSGSSLDRPIGSTRSCATC